LKESSIKSLTIQKPKNSFSQPTPMKFIVWKKYLKSTEFTPNVRLFGIYPDDFCIKLT